MNISCSERAKQYPKGTLHADDGRLFCTTCNITLDHTRKGTIDRHLVFLDFFENTQCFSQNFAMFFR